MSGLTVGGTTIPIAWSGLKRDRSDWVDRARAFDGTYRASSTGGAVREWGFQTPPVTRTLADTYEAVLSLVAAQTCSGDVLALPTMCCTEITGWTPVTTAQGHSVVIDFVLHEVQPARVLFKYSAGDTLTGETFTRSTAGRYYSSAGVVTSAAIDTKRDSHYIGGVRHILLEAAGTNLCLQSENFSATWSALGTPTRTGAFSTGSGVSLDLIGDDSGAAVEGYEQTITFTGNAAKAISLFVTGGGSAVSSTIRLRDNTASANRLLAVLTWSGGLPSLAMTTGTFIGYDTLASSTFRLRFQTTSVTAANTNQLGIYPATDAALTVTNQGTLVAGGVQAENNPFPTSYIPTTTLTLTRGADSYQIPFTVPPQEMSVYAKFNERGTISTSTGRIFTISNSADAGPELLIGPSSNFYQIYHQNGASSVTSTLAAAPSIGDTVELAGRLYGDASDQISQSVNSGAETTGTQSANNGFAAAWASTLLWLNSAGTVSAGYTAIQSLKIIAGTRSLTELRVL